MDPHHNTPAQAEGGAAPITAVLAKAQARITCLPRYFGPLHIAVENAVYDMMGRLCERYAGGYWEYYELSNGGFYMVPTAAERFRLECDGNGYAGELSAHAAGIGVCAMTYSQLSFWRDGARMAEMYYRLRDFIDVQAEARQLYALLD